MTAPAHRLNILLAIQRAQAAGFVHLAAALVELARKSERANSIPTPDSVNHDKNQHGKPSINTAGQ